MTKVKARKRAPDERAIRIEAALASMAEGLCVFDAGRRLIVSNAHYATIYGLPPELVIPGTPHSEIVAYRLAHGTEPFVDADGTQKRQEVLLSALKPASEIVQLRCGRTILIRHQTLSIGGWVATHVDITEQKLGEKLLAQQNVWFDAAINNMRQGLCMYDANRRLIVSNRLYATMYRIPPEAIKPGMLLEEIVALRLNHGNEPITGNAGYLQRRVDLVENLKDDDDIVELQDGRVISILHRPMASGGWVSTHQDITEHRRNEDRIRHLARHDALTDLANRMVLQERVAELQGRIARGERIAILGIDLDHFKNVNDTLGHEAGDELLKLAAARLTECCRDTDLVVRMGGDEFAILQVSIGQPDSASILARRVVNAIAEPFDIAGHKFMIGASIGISVAPFDGTDAKTLMRCADLALYRAKNEGRNAFHFYEQGMDETLQRRRSIEAGLRSALSGNEFTLAYQPLVNIAENRICAFEALLRWVSPEHGAMSPADFIPIAEKTGLISPIGEWVLRQACTTATTWPDQVSVAVNLSPVQFKNRHLVDQVKSALADTGLRPGRVQLEITESVLLVQSKATLAILHELRDMGVKLSMDDFGTGYSSLSYLLSFPFDKIKIDRFFVQDSSNTAGARAIVKAVVGLGQSLGMAITAEGVETAEHLALVRELGCTEVQGFLFSKPLPESLIPALLARSGSACFLPARMTAAS